MSLNSRFKMRESIYLLVVLFVVSWYPAAARDCVTSGPCSCNFDDGSGSIDLSSIAVSGGGSLIQDAFASDGYAYSYNPCYGFTEGTCYNAAACQFDSANVVYYNIGDSAQATFFFDGLNTIINYVSDDGARSSKVTLICDETAVTPVTQVLGETSKSFYEFSITTNAACVDAPAPPGSSTTPHSHVTATIDVEVSISTGSVMCIVFFTVVPVYFIAGVLVNRFGRQRQGKDMVPNLVLWAAIPGLIKEGFVFTFSLCGRRRQYGKV